mmetsp:Transcript_19759/g.57317  ORF Transcript_19759/g.57317 Transcript_19759/m.57317 type:complete len:204 (-) Transcript_19759:80-691(-)
MSRNTQGLRRGGRRPYGRHCTKGTLAQSGRYPGSIDSVVIGVGYVLSIPLFFPFSLVIVPLFESPTLVVGHIEDVVHVPVAILRLRLVWRETPVVVHDELVLVHAPGQLLDDVELVARSHHWNLLSPAIEGGSQVNLLATMVPGENHRDALVLPAIPRRRSGARCVGGQARASRQDPAARTSRPWCGSCAPGAAHKRLLPGLR